MGGTTVRIVQTVQMPPKSGGCGRMMPRTNRPTTVRRQVGRIARLRTVRTVWTALPTVALRRASCEPSNPPRGGPGAPCRAASRGCGAHDDAPDGAPCRSGDRAAARWIRLRSCGSDRTSGALHTGRAGRRFSPRPDPAPCCSARARPASLRSLAIDSAGVRTARDRPCVRAAPRDRAGRPYRSPSGCCRPCR